MRDKGRTLTPGSPWYELWPAHPYARHVAAQLGEYETWLDAEEKKQAKLAITAPPSLLSADVKSRLAEPRRVYARLKGTKKPKPPPAAPTNATGNGTADGTADGAEGADPAEPYCHIWDVTT